MSSVEQMSKCVFKVRTFLLTIPYICFFKETLLYNRNGCRQKTKGQSNWKCAFEMSRSCFEREAEPVNKSQALFSYQLFLCWCCNRIYFHTASSTPYLLFLLFSAFFLLVSFLFWTGGDFFLSQVKPRMFHPLEKTVVTHRRKRGKRRRMFWKQLLKWLL